MHRSREAPRRERRRRHDRRPFLRPHIQPRARIHRAHRDPGALQDRGDSPQRVQRDDLRRGRGERPEREGAVDRVLLDRGRLQREGTLPRSEHEARTAREHRHQSVQRHQPRRGCQALLRHPHEVPRREDLDGRRGRQDGADPRRLRTEQRDVQLGRVHLHGRRHRPLRRPGACGQQADVERHAAGAGQLLPQPRVQGQGGVRHRSGPLRHGHGRSGRCPQRGRHAQPDKAGQIPVLRRPRVLPVRHRGRRRREHHQRQAHHPPGHQRSGGPQDGPRAADRIREACEEGILR